MTSEEPATFEASGLGVRNGPWCRPLYQTRYMTDVPTRSALAPQSSLTKIPAMISLHSNYKNGFSTVIFPHWPLMAFTCSFLGFLRSVSASKNKSQILPPERGIQVLSKC